MRKTLVLTHDYYPHKGGVANYVYHLFRFFDKKKFMVVSDCPDLQPKDNIIYVKLIHKYIWPSWLLAWWQIRKIIKEHKIELIFTPNILPLGTIAMFSNIPYIVSLHGLDINLAIKNKFSLTQKILRNAEHIIVNSKHTRSSLGVFNLNREKIKLIYPSVELIDDFHQDHLNYLKRKYNIEDNDKVLLTVGRLNKRKAQDMVIKAMANLDKHTKYFIVGRGDFETDLRKTINHYKLRDRVFIFNNVSDEELVYYYQMADIFVLPNKKTDVEVEGFGIVFLEAAYYGLPIIAGNSGGVLEILQDDKNALLVNGHSLRQLIQALYELLNNKVKADRLSQNARSTYNKFSGYKVQSDKLKKLLE